jgi:hypothetical protein
LNKKLEEGKIKPGNRREEKERNGIEWKNLKINKRQGMR